MQQWLLRISMVIILVVLVFLVWVFRNLRDRHPGYELDLRIDGAAAPGPLQVGFAALPITPAVPDTWIDSNGDARFREEDGDRYEDRNGNGVFDAIYIAGFHGNRPAQGVHDDLWTRVMVIDDGQTRLAVAVLDAIGFLHDDVLDVRERIPESAGIDYTVICSTHDHEAPDLIGIWGKTPFVSGVNSEYLEFVKHQTAAAIARAAGRLRVAKLRFVQDMEAARAWVHDTRRPIVLDPGIRVMQAVDAETDTTLGVFISWANHPETLWSHNLQISSDFPHYVRYFVEKGIYHGERLVQPGLGGVAVYANGAIGGLMTTSPEFAIPDAFSDTSYTEPSFAKARAQGLHLARVVLQMLDRPEVVEIRQAGISLRAKSFHLPVDNLRFRLAAALGVINRGFEKGFKMQSEAAVWTLGPASFITIPGEIYPEIVNGGIEAPAGQDFSIQPLEIPPLRELMPGQFKFVLGLANDEIGYIIPKSEWDEEPPFLYNADSSPYGEINSTGPEAAPIIHNVLKELLQDLRQSPE